MKQSPFNQPASHKAIFTLLASEVGEELANKHWKELSEVRQTLIDNGENAELVTYRLKAIINTINKVTSPPYNLTLKTSDNFNVVIEFDKDISKEQSEHFLALIIKFACDLGVTKKQFKELWSWQK
jgi:hypothetical protein